MAEMNFEAMGRFIYGAARYGGDLTDVHNWMAADLDVPAPLPEDGGAKRQLYQAFFSKYQDLNALHECHQRFMTMLKDRPSPWSKCAKKRGAEDPNT